MAVHPSALLIFGTSHVGKSTLASRLGEALGWQVISTDKLARHPGRPWPEVRKPVAEYYSSLSDETIYWFLRVHHENMWPLLRQKISGACQMNQGIVLEGTALRPEYIAELDRQKVLAIGLYAERAFLRKRIESESFYAQQNGRMRLLIDKFITRSLRDNETIVEAANRLGLRLLDVADEGNLKQLAEELIGVMGSGGPPR
jgi:2-phosphoglycerate kinase